jgi:hypothetical protein
MKTLTKPELKKEQEQEEIEGIPICASNLATPVTDRTILSLKFITE